MPFVADAHGKMYQLIDKLLILPDFCDYTVQLHNGIDHAEWNRMPFYNLLNHCISNF